MDSYELDLSVKASLDKDVCTATETIQPSRDVADDQNVDGDDNTSPLSMMAWQDVLKLRRLEAKLRKPPDAPVLKRNVFCASQKKAVCEMAAATSMSHQALADHFGVERSMITRVLLKKDKWLKSKHTPGLEFARKRINKFWQIEDALMVWLMECRDQGVLVTNKMIKEIALAEAERLGMRGGGHPHQFVGGRPWLKTINARFGIIDGVATRLGFTDTDLAREKAYGRFPLDERFLVQIPDENGNVVDPFQISPSMYEGVEFEERGEFIVAKSNVPANPPVDLPIASRAPSSPPHLPDALTTGTTPVSVASTSTLPYTVSNSPSTSPCTPVPPSLSVDLYSAPATLPGPSAAPIPLLEEPVEWCPHPLPSGFISTVLDASDDSHTSFDSSGLSAHPTALVPHHTPTLPPFDLSRDATVPTSYGAPDMQTLLPVSFGPPDTFIYPSPASNALSTFAVSSSTYNSPSTSTLSSTPSSLPATPPHPPLLSSSSVDQSAHIWAGAYGNAALQHDCDYSQRQSLDATYHDTEASKGSVYAAFHNLDIENNPWPAQSHTISQASEWPPLSEPYMGRHMDGTLAPWM